MANDKKKPVAAPQTQAITKWDEELAKQAEVAAGMEANTGGGKFFSLKAGVLSFDGAPIKGNEMAVIIVDHILENVFYEGDYDAENPQSPTCFAFGRDEPAMKPHLTVIQAKQNADGLDGEGCPTCPKNQWGSAEKGKGKACKNSRRIAMISAGGFAKDGSFELEEDEEHYKTTPVAYMRLPVMSVKGFAGFVKQVAASAKRPPHGIITRVKVVPDPKSQFRVEFEAVQNVPDELMGTIMERNKAERAVIEFPYSLGGEDEEAKPQAKKPQGRTPPKKGKY